MKTKPPYWMIALAMIVLTALPVAPVLAQGQTAEYTQPADSVISALVGLLGDTTQVSLVSTQVAMQTALAAGNTSVVNTPSTAVANAEISQYVHADDQQYIGDATCRYVLTVTVEPGTDGAGTRVRVIPLIIIEVGGSDSALGGRLVRSNGTLEGNFLTSLSQRLGQ